MDYNKLRNDVERWLVHNNYSFDKIKDDDNVFHFMIKHVGAFGNPIYIFQPKQQKNVLVTGSKVPLKNNQNARYLKLSEGEKERFEEKIQNYCKTIMAIYRPHIEEGKKRIGVYVVLDKEDQFNQQFFLDAIDRVSEMSDKMTQFLIKAF